MLAMPLSVPYGGHEKSGALRGGEGDIMSRVLLFVAM